MNLQALNVAQFLALLAILFVSLHYVTPVAGDLSMFKFLDGRADAFLVMLLGLQFGASANLKQGGLLIAIGFVLIALDPTGMLLMIGLSLSIGALALRFLPRQLHWFSLAIILIWPLIALGVDHQNGWALTGYADLWTPIGFLRNTLFNGWHPLIPWAAFFTFGMWLATVKFSEATPRRLAVGGFFLALIFKALSGIAAKDEWGIADMVSLTALPPNPFFVGYTLAVCLSALGIILWLTPRIGAVADLLAVPGKMPFTLYTLIALMLAIFARFAPIPFSAGILTIQIGATLLLFAHIWVRFMPAGPLETLLAKLR